MKFSGYIRYDTENTWLDCFTLPKLGAIEVCPLKVFLVAPVVIIITIITIIVMGIIIIIFIIITIIIADVIITITNNIILYMYSIHMPVTYWFTWYNSHFTEQSIMTDPIWEYDTGADSVHISWSSYRTLMSPLCISNIIYIRDR